MNSRFPAMHLPIQPPIEPVEGHDVDELPPAAGFLFEPKWDGFRCVAFRDERTVVLQSKSGEPLTRYFPEAVMALSQLPRTRFVLDGELVVIGGDGLRYDRLQERIHPSARRVAQLSARSPATFVAYDLLCEGDDSLIEQPLSSRRKRLEAFFAGTSGGGVHLSPATTRRPMAQTWLKNLESAGADGVVARRLDRPYGGPRDGALIVRPRHTIDCVVGGVRRGPDGQIASLLLGLYDEDALLHYVGSTQPLPAPLRRDLDVLVRPLVEAPGFTGRAPAGDTRSGSTSRPRDVEPLRPALVCEVEYDRFTGEQFRHAPTFLRFRPDHPVRRCTLDQVRPSERQVDKGMEVLGL